MKNVIKSDYYESPLGYINVDWFVNKVIKSEIKMAFFFKNTHEDILLTEKIEDYFLKMIEFVSFVNKLFNLVKLEINVILLVITEVQLIAKVVLMLRETK